MKPFFELKPACDKVYISQNKIDALKSYKLYLSKHKHKPNGLQKNLSDKLLETVAQKAQMGKKEESKLVLTNSSPQFMDVTADPHVSYATVSTHSVVNQYRQNGGNEDLQHQSTGYQSCEQVDSDDLTGGLDFSDEDFDQETLDSQARKHHRIQKQKRRAKGKEPKSTNYRMEVDTNVFELRYTMTGEKFTPHENLNIEESPRSAIHCTECTACYNVHSKSKRLEGNKKLWICEFCGQPNEIMMIDWQHPKSETIDYLIKSGSNLKLDNNEHHNAQGHEQQQDTNIGNVVFCLDVSGSLNHKVNTNHYEIKQNELTQLNRSKLKSMSMSRRLQQIQTTKDNNQFTNRGAVPSLFGKLPDPVLSSCTINTPSARNSQQEGTFLTGMGAPPEQPAVGSQTSRFNEKKRPTTFGQSASQASRNDMFKSQIDFTSIQRRQVHQALNFWRPAVPTKVMQKKLMTRLDCVKESMGTQLDSLRNHCPDKIVGLVCFDDQLRMLGDCQGYRADDWVTLGDDWNYDFELLKQFGENQASVIMQKPIRSQYDCLKFSLQDQQGSQDTALGPALLSAISLASMSKNSKGVSGGGGGTVILITNGQANRGLGSTCEDFRSNVVMQRNKFYLKTIDYATQRGVTVHIVMLQGEEQYLKGANKICTQTNGTLEFINPYDLTQQFNCVSEIINGHNNSTPRNNITGKKSGIVQEQSIVFCVQISEDVNYRVPINHLQVDVIQPPASDTFFPKPNATKMLDLSSILRKSRAVYNRNEGDNSPVMRSARNQYPRKLNPIIQSAGKIACDNNINNRGRDDSPILQQSLMNSTYQEGLGSVYSGKYGYGSGAESPKQTERQNSIDSPMRTTLKSAYELTRRPSVPTKIMVKKLKSKLDCLKTALTATLTNMKTLRPDSKVNLVAFDEKIKLYGDCCLASVDDQFVVISSENDQKIRYDFDLIQDLAADVYKNKKIKPIHQSCGNMQKILQMQKSSSSNEYCALGPAILASITLASNSNAIGSAVLLVLDSLANWGLGAFYYDERAETKIPASTFYHKLGQIAFHKGVSINILTLQDNDQQNGELDCNLQDLVGLCHQTGGKVDSVNPNDLEKKVHGLLCGAYPCLASKVTVKIKLHKALRFRNCLLEHIDQNNPSWMQKQIGNIMQDGGFTFEYSLKHVAELARYEELDLGEIKKLPFQAQIMYTAPDGSEWLQVVTQKIDITNIKPYSWQGSTLNVDFGMMCRSSAQHSAAITLVGDPSQGLAIAKSYHRYLKKVQLQLALQIANSNSPQNFEAEDQQNKIKYAHEEFNKKYQQVYQAIIDARKPFRDRDIRDEDYNNEYHKKMKSQLKKRRIYYEDNLAAELTTISSNGYLRAAKVAQRVAQGAMKLQH